MKAWTAIGAIFSLIGLVILVFGVARYSQLESLYNQSGASQLFGSLGDTIIWNACAPYIIGAIVFFIIGGVGFVAGSGGNSNKPDVLSVPPTVNYSQTPPPLYQVGTVRYRSACGFPNPKENQFCGRCGKSLSERTGFTLT
jgi:hypothetical protein